MPPANTQFSIAVHLMARLAFEAGGPVTSAQLAASINASPSFVRRILSKLVQAGLVKATTGKTGCCILGRPEGKITLLDIYQALVIPKFFAVHGYPTMKNCPVSCHVRDSMDKVLVMTRQLIRKSLAKTTLGQIVSDIKQQCK